MVKKKVVSLSILGVVMLIIGYLFLYESPYDGLIEDYNQVLVFAHRGFGEYAPDNGMSAVQMAMDNSMDGVDIDGQLTKDGELVIFHDVSVDRLTDDTGRVDELTLEEFKKLNLSGEAPGTFEEALQKVLAEEDSIMMVELKTPAVFNTGIEARAIEIVKKYDAYERVYLSSFNPVVLYRLKKIDPTIRTVFIFMDTNWFQEIRDEVPEGELADLPFFLRGELWRRAIRKIINPDMLSVHQEVDSKTIQNLLNLNWPIFLWPPDSDEDLKNAFEKSPYGIITNEPLKGLKWKAH